MRTRVARLATSLLAGAAVVALSACAPGGPASEAGREARDFSYRGGCAWDKPATDTKLLHGNQDSTPVERDGASSRAQLVNTREVLLGDEERPFLLVRLQCSVGPEVLTGYHLLGADQDGVTVDYGIVAAANTDIDIEVDDGELVVSHEYRSMADSALSFSGDLHYRVAMVGETPIRLFEGQTVADVPAGVAQWEPNQWRNGVVTLASARPGEDATYAMGVQIDRLHVVTARTAERVGDYCPVIRTRTHAGQLIDPIGAATWAHQTGTLIELSMPSEAADSADIGQARVPPDSDLEGLLVTSSGVVPTPARAEPAGDAAVQVIAQMETDSTLANYPFEQPEGMFVNEAGEVLYLGQWANAGQGAPPETGPALMLPLPDPEVDTDQPCSF